MVTFETVKIKKMHESYENVFDHYFEEEEDTPETKKYIKDMQGALEEAFEYFNYRYPTRYRMTSRKWNEMIHDVFYDSLRAYVVIQALGLEEFCDMIWRMEVKKAEAHDKTVNNFFACQSEADRLGISHHLKEYTPSEFVMMYNPKLEGDKIKAEPKYGMFQRDVERYIEKHHDEIVKELKERN